MIKRKLGFLIVLGALALTWSCGGDNSANNNVGQNLNTNNLPSNVGVVVNDNGNKNTAGVSTINSNSHANENGSMKAGNANRRP